MNIIPSKLVSCITAMMVVGAVSATAQPNIQFTVPVESKEATKTDGLESTYRKKLSVGAYNAPVPVFGKLGAAGSFDIIPGSVTYGADSANARQWKQFLDGKKNWTLSTPEEIMGVQTPEKILGLTDAKDDPKLSLEEKFLARQSHPSFGLATNGVARSSDFWSVNSASELFNRRDESSGLQKMNGGKVDYEPMGYNQSYKTMANVPSSMTGRPNGETGGNPFGLPAATPKVSQDQLDAMDRYHDLLNFGSQSEKPAVTSSYSALGAAPASTSGGSSASLFSAAPQENRTGRPVQSLFGDVSKPTGITPLPGITRVTPPVVKKSATQPKLPPWLSDSPTPFKTF